MDNENKEESFSSSHVNLKSDELNTHYNQIKHITKDYILNSPYLMKAQDASKEFMKNYLINPITNIFNTKFPEIRDAVFNHQIVNIPLTLIENSNYKNMIQLKFNNRSYKITHTDRKMTVLVLTVTGAIVHYLRSRRDKFKFKWLIPYYVFFSLILCRENLDPYGS